MQPGIVCSSCDNVSSSYNVSKNQVLGPPKIANRKGGCFAMASRSTAGLAEGPFRGFRCEARETELNRQGLESKKEQETKKTKHTTDIVWW
jgi:hypothetical protein